jgi:hypothetical protein
MILQKKTQHLIRIGERFLNNYSTKTTQIEQYLLFTRSKVNIIFADKLDIKFISNLSQRLSVPKQHQKHCLSVNG